MKKIKTYNLITRKPKLAIAWKPNGVSLFLFNKAENLKYESIPLDKFLADALVSKVKSFLGNIKPSETILILPRSEVLQKELAITPAESLRENLEIKITQLLPYSPKEMAYSLAVHSNRGLLYAIPEQKIKEILDFLAKAGITTDEVVSEDQTLFWLFQNKTTNSVTLVLNPTSERTLFLAFKENTILLSRVYPPEEEFKNILSEISFSLLDAGVKPAKAIIAFEKTVPGSPQSLSGDLSAHRLLKEITTTLEIPAEIYQRETLEGSMLPPALLGAKHWGKSPVISLLPSHEKLKKREQKKNRLLKEIFAAFGVMIFCFSFLAVSHLFFLKHKKMQLEKEILKQAAAVTEIRQITDSLDAIHEAENSKDRFLLLLQELAARLPGSVRLKELEVEGQSIVFQGESPSHALLAEAVQVLEKIEGIQEAKLEHARLRKRLNQDFFDFEVTAQWQS